jgi:hypothetical protein
MWGIHTLIERGDVAGADAEIERLAVLPETARRPASRWFALMARAMRATMEGRFAAGEALALEALEAGRSWRLGAAIQCFGAQLNTLRWLQGRLGEIEPILARSAERSPAAAVFPAALALIHSGGVRAAGADGERAAEARATLARWVTEDPTVIPIDET